MREEFTVLLFFFGISLTANLGLLIGFIRSSRRARRLERSAIASRPADDDRTARLEEALDALAAQVDHISAGQQFLSRMVLERKERLPKPPVDVMQEVTPQ